MDIDSGGRMTAATLSTGSSSESGVIGGKFSDHFPAGLRVLVVDDDPTCLMILEKMLRNCNYEVTKCSKAAVALSLLRKKKDGFDLVLSDVYMPDMDGFKLLEHIGLEMDLPVIMMSADDTFDVVRKGVTHGACDYLIKPVRMEAIKNIWQHVVRKRKNELKELEHSGSVEETDKQKRLLDDADYASSAVEGGWRHSKRRKDGKDEEDEGENREDTSAVKKPRVVWSVELHQQFVAAVNQLGIDKAVPKKILELMNVPGLTRENVASHLQKYRLYLRRVSETSQHPSKPNTSFMGAPEAPFGSIGSLDGLDLQALEISNQLQPPNLVTLQTGLGRTPNSGMGMPLGCQMKLFNSDAQSADLSKMRSGLIQELGNTQLNLLHGLPTSVEPKQPVHFNQSVQPFGNMDLQVGEGNLGFLNSPASLVRVGSSRGAIAGHGSHSGPLMMQIGQQREQLAVAQPQTQMQLHMSQQQQLRGQLLNKIASGQPSGLPTPLGERMLSNEIAGPVLGRNGTVVAGCGNALPVGTCNSNLSYTAVSQTSSVDFPVSNSMELLGNHLPITATAGITSLPKMCQEAMPAAGNLEGLDHTIGIKGSRSLVPSYDTFNEFYKSKNQNWRLQNVNNAYDSIWNTNSIRGNPGFGMGNQNFGTIRRNEKDRNACIGAKGLSTPSAKDENGNLGISMQTQSNNAVHNSFTVKVESGPNLICDTNLLEEQFIQDDVMNALFKQQQEEIGLVNTDFNFDGGPMG